MPDPACIFQQDDNHDGMEKSPALIIFSDLDGCLLNKHDYQWRDAEKCLLRLSELQIPVVLASSKTAVEMEALAAELPIVDAPLICENGGAIHWRSLRAAGESGVSSNGAQRATILKLLAELKSQFKFRSFRDLMLNGVMEATGLDEIRANAALSRQCTEPLLWDDSPARRSEFADILHQRELTFTKGGRFWHVAGQTSKGEALKLVMERYNAHQPIVVAVGDSQIDQSMLNAADIPVGICVDGNLSVNVSCPPGIVPKAEGAKGWAEAITEIVKRFV